MTKQEIAKALLDKGFVFLKKGDFDILEFIHENGLSAAAIGIDHVTLFKTLGKCVEPLSYKDYEEFSTDWVDQTLGSMDIRYS